MPVHEVRQGEHLARIIRQYGFTDPDFVWGQSANQPLREQGRTPSTLAPGDLVTIPERAAKTLGKSTDQRHRLRVKQRTYRLHLVLRDAEGRPAANLPCILRVGAADQALTTTSDGSLQADIPADLESADVTVGQGNSSLSGARFVVLIGHLDPVELITGQEARLNNLGFRAGTSGDSSAPVFRSAVEEFQSQHGLGVDGICGPQTQRKLVQIHGC